MFTGIVEEVGVVERVEARAVGARVRVRAPGIIAGVKEGDSVAVSGVCLTAVEVRGESFGGDVSPETLQRTSLGGLRAGSQVNLERALTPESRLGGHIMQGHVDGSGTVTALERLGDGNWWLKVRVPPEVERYVVWKGSLAIDGISLTVAEVAGDEVAVAVIPHTYERTTLRLRRAGDAVNLETDILAKYVEKMLRGMELKVKGLTVEGLRGQGF